MKYTFIHILIQEIFVEKFLKLSHESDYNFFPAVRTGDSIYFYYRCKLLPQQATEERMKEFLRCLIEINSDIFYRIEKV